MPRAPVQGCGRMRRDRRPRRNPAPGSGWCAPARQRGVTLLETAVVVAIIVILFAVGWSNLGRLRPRGHVAAAAGELQALFYQARHTALATGHDVCVLVFPQYAAAPGLTVLGNSGGGSAGRVIVYEDGNYDFFSGAGTVNFNGYDPGTPKANTRSQVLATFDLPIGVTVGPTTGMGASAVLPAPLAGIDVTKDCSFCGALSDHRGAVKFDSRGRAWFYGQNGAPALSSSSLSTGGSLSLTAAEVGGQTTLVITPVTGTVQVINNG